MNKDIFRKYNSFLVIGIVIGIIVSATGVYAVTQYASDSVYYINKNSNLSSNNVQGAIDELASIHKADSNGCPVGYICTKDLPKYSINLKSNYSLPDSATSSLNSGTAKVYFLKDDGVYLDREYTKKMTTTENAITVPTVTGYTFKGYYSSDNEKLIDENGYITSNFTSTKFSKDSTLNAKWEANNYIVTLNTNKPAPLNDGYYTDGTNTVYMKYDSGIYLDDNYSNKMTTSDNAVTKPTAVGYNFLGYYDGDTQMIDENGKITSNFIDNKYSEEKTLTAKWKRNFTCTQGSNITYMGKQWYVISNSNNVCEMVLNATVGNSSGNTYNAGAGTGTGSVYSYVKGYSSNSVTLEKEYNAGLISSVDASPGNVGSSKPTGVYWVSSGSIYSSTAYYTYTIPSTTYAVTQGYAYTNKATDTANNLTYYAGYTTDSVSEKVIVAAGGTASLSNTSSKLSYNNKPSSSVANSSNGGWSIYETRFTYNLDGTNGISTSCTTNDCHWGIPLYKRSYKNSGGTVLVDTGMARSYIWNFYSCGGSHRTKATRIALEMKDSSTTDSFYYSDYGNANTKNNRSTSSKLILAFAGRSTRSDSLTGSASKTGKNTATFDLNSDADCKTTYKKWNSVTSGSVAVMYRPHIKVKMNT